MSDTLERLRQAVAKEEGGYDGFPVSFESGDLRALLAVVEAAQGHYDEWLSANGGHHDALPLPIQNIGNKLAALDSGEPLHSDEIEVAKYFEPDATSGETER